MVAPNKLHGATAELIGCKATVIFPAVDVLLHPSLPPLPPLPPLQPPPPHHVLISRFLEMCTDVLSKLHGETAELTGCKATVIFLVVDALLPPSLPPRPPLPPLLLLQPPPPHHVLISQFLEMSMVVLSKLHGATVELIGFKATVIFPAVDALLPPLLPPLPQQL
jgi:hypothetical protein